MLNFGDDTVINELNGRSQPTAAFALGPTGVNRSVFSDRSMLLDCKRRST